MALTSGTRPGTPASTDPQRATYVLGGGAVGLYLQFLLQGPAGSVLIARRPTYERFQASPLRLSGALEGTVFPRCHTWESLPEKLVPHAAVFVATRAPELAAALEALKPKLSKTSTVVLCQSGIGVFRLGEKALPKIRILRLLPYVEAERWELDHLHVRELGRLELAGEPGDEVELERWRGHLSRPLVKVATCLTPIALEWREALLPIAVNALATLADAPCDAVDQSPELRASAFRLLDEAIQTARLDGVSLSAGDRASAFQRLAAVRTPANPTLSDLRRGRPHELAFWNGAVVELARQHREGAPLNELVLGLVTHLEKAGRWRNAAARPARA